jgi:hypothetical protein
MKTAVHESSIPRNRRISASTEFARDVFAWQEQIHTDRQTIPNTKPISAFDFRLAYAITQYTNKYSRKAWPFQETLAADLDVDVRTVGRGIANLVKRGHLSVTRRGRDEPASSQVFRPHPFGISQARVLHGAYRRRRDRSDQEARNLQGSARRRRRKRSGQGHRILRAHEARPGNRRRRQNGPASWRITMSIPSPRI